MNRGCTACLALICLALLVGLPIEGRAAEHPDARNTSLNVNPVRLNPSGKGILATGSADPMSHMEFRASVVGQFLTEPLLVDPDESSQTRSLVAQRQQVDATAAIGLFDRLEFGLTVPTTVYQDAEFPGFGLGPVASGGLGNVELYGLIGLLSQQNAPLSIAVGAPVRLPTKTNDAYLGVDGVAAAPQLRIGRSFGPVRLAATGDVLFQPSTSLNNVVDGRRIRWRTGVMYAPVPEWSLGTEFIGSTTLESPFDAPDATRGEVLFGGHLRPTRTTDIHLAVGRGVIRGIGAPSFRVLAGFSLHYGRPGAPKPVDPCSVPTEGSYEGVSPEDCPESDFDGDGIANQQDQCALEAEDLEGYRDADGCPDTDNDGDGIADEDDACVNVAEDADSYQDEDGCPDLDNDADGFADKDDRCPSEPEDFDGFEDDNGCPDTDNDNDAVFDVNDACPNAAGEATQDGCPSVKPPEATVTDKKIEISERIFFVTDRAIIRPRSYDVLEKVGEALRNNPDITRVEIRGYSDERGKTKYNYYLSQERAKVVRLYLIHNSDIAPERLTAAGYGEVKRTPSTSEGEKARGESERDWAKARRVEFKILERSE